MGTCQGWTELDGCGECIIPLTDTFYISSLDSECIASICRAVLDQVSTTYFGGSIVLFDKSYVSCSGTIYLHTTHVHTNFNYFLYYAKWMIYMLTLTFRTNSYKYPLTTKKRLRMLDLVVYLHTVLDMDALSTLMKNTLDALDNVICNSINYVVVIKYSH